MGEGAGQSLEAPWSPRQPADGCLRARDLVSEGRFVLPNLKGVFTAVHSVPEEKQ